MESAESIHFINQHILYNVMWCMMIDEHAFHQMIDEQPPAQIGVLTNLFKEQSTIL